MLIIVWGFAYLLLQLHYIYHWSRIPEFHPDPLHSSSTPVSVIIIARNEAANIKACIEGLLKQAYSPSLIEMIIVDDHSTDTTFSVVESFNDDRIKVYRLADFPAMIMTETGVEEECKGSG